MSPRENRVRTNRLPASGKTEMRWLVSLELMHEPRLGQTRDALLVWTVRPYVLMPDGERRIGAAVAQHARWALPIAVARARLESTRFLTASRPARRLTIRRAVRGER